MSALLNIKSLRLRLGWTQADLARRLNCEVAEVSSWELGIEPLSPKVCSELQILFSQAEAYAEEIHCGPQAESLCEQQDLGQIEISIFRDSFN